MGIECNTFGFLSIVYHVVCFVFLFVSILAARLCAGFVGQLYLHLPARLFGRSFYLANFFNFFDFWLLNFAQREC